MKIRRARHINSGYDLSTLLAHYHEKISEPRDPDDKSEYAIEKKLGGKYYLVRYDYREIPDYDPFSLVQVPDPPLDTTGKIDYYASGHWEKIREAKAENSRRLAAFSQGFEALLKGKLGS